MIEQFFEAMIAASTDKECYNLMTHQILCLGKCWNCFQPLLVRLNQGALDAYRYMEDQSLNNLSITFETDITQGGGGKGV